MRHRSETIGPLGRAPARTSIQPPSLTPVPGPNGPQHGDKADKGGVRRWIRGALVDNIGLKALSLVLAVTVFLLVNDDKDREITVRVGVLYVLPDNKVLTSDRIDEVRVTLRGPWRRLQRFDERELGRITLDLRNAPTGEVSFTNDMIHPPAGLTVASIAPRTMRVTFDKRDERQVEISPLLAGHPQHGYVVVEAKATPSTVKVRGAEKSFSTLQTVPTQEISVEGRTESFTVTSKVVPPEGIELTSPEPVSVHVQIDEQLVHSRLPAVPIRIAAAGAGIDPARWSVEPRQVEITLTGTALAVEKAKETLKVSAEVLPGDRGTRDADVVVDGIPPGVGVRKSPERVKLTPVTAPR